jgi:flagellar biosynthetic protein FliR
VQAGATLLDTMVGFSFGALVDPISGLNGAVLARVYALFATMVFVLAGGIRLMVTGVARSYDVVPLGEFPSTASLGRLAVDALTAIPVIGFELVGPVILAVVIADAAFGLVSRAVPQMNVFVIGLPVKVIVSFAVVAMSLPFVSQQLQDDLEAMISTALRGLGG